MQLVTNAVKMWYNHCLQPSILQEVWEDDDD